jgi:hypothetical protein
MKATKILLYIAIAIMIVGSVASVSMTTYNTYLTYKLLKAAELRQK